MESLERQEPWDEDDPVLPKQFVTLSRFHHNSRSHIRRPQARCKSPKPVQAAPGLEPTRLMQRRFAARPV